MGVDLRQIGLYILQFGDDPVIISNVKDHEEYMERRNRKNGK